MFLRLFLLVQIVLVSVTASVLFQDCGSGYELYAVDIEGCGWSQPCYVTTGEDVPVKIMFYADFPSLLLDQDVIINVNFVNLNTDVTPDSCKTEDCPVRTNTINSYTSTMTVPARIALNSRGYLHWRVYNESKKLVLCYSVLVQTQSPRQKRLRQFLYDLISPKHANQIVDSLNWDTS